MMRRTACFVAFLIGVSASGVCSAQDQRPAGIDRGAITAALEELYQKPQGLIGDEFTPIVVTADGLEFPDSVEIFGVPLAVKSRAQARDEQLAWFIYVPKLESNGDELTVHFQRPYNGRFGTISLKRDDGAWAVAGRQDMHSSSGARAFYGQLYEGVSCKDGSEMARRWNGNIDAMNATSARRPRTEMSKLSTKCPGEVFPDVVSYQQIKALGVGK